MAEVTSSRTISLGLRKRDRARQTSCLWPWERFAPPDVMRVERLVKLTVVGGWGVDATAVASGSVGPTYLRGI
jgi:hypothetical protein